MKKVLVFLTALVLLISLSLLAGCGGKTITDSSTKTSAEPVTDPKTEPVTEPTTEGHVHAWDDGKIVASPSCHDTGLKLFTCATCSEKKTETLPKTDNHIWDNGYMTVVPTASAEGSRLCTCTICKTERDFKLTLAEYTEEVNAVKALVADFKIDDFGGATITTDFFAAAGVSKYDATPVSPTVGQHPRVLFSESDIPGIKAAFSSADNSAAVTEFINLLKKNTDGKLPAATVQSEGTHNFSSVVLAQIQALALDYVINGNEVSGYRAIYAMKNNILTLNIVNISSDQCRQYGNTMYIAACVYDWCYNLLTSEDKLQFTSGIEHLICTGSNEAGAKMEVGFPPKGQAAVSGHGSERQILRDYLSYAIAVFDELPTWWEFVGGRYYEEYVPVRNLYYEAGMYPQGVSNYVRGRFVSDLWSAWLIKGMSGTIPFNADQMKEVMRTVYTYELPGRFVFNSGDSGSATATFRSNYGTCTLISSYLFNDATMRAQLVNIGHSYTSFEYANSFATPVESLICSSNGLKPAEDRHEDMPLIRYNGGWLGQIIARNSWTDDKATVVLMKIGQRSTANHDHEDAGQFQIFYRSLLAGDSGCYASYGSDHHKYYHRATVAHNSLLIYNQNLKSTNGGYYSGGQRVLNETGTLEGWLTDTYKTGTVTGYAYAYADEKETKPIYAYIAGDITPAYDSATVSDVNRRMLTVYTGDANIPMIFVVFDNITAQDASFKKTFLLHTVKEPTISGNTVTVVNGDGKLTLQNLLGGDSITKLGGEGQNFLINGKQLATNNGSTDGFWGRVEISPNTGSLNNKFLNVMFVSDADSTASMPATLIESATLTGAQMGDYVFLFVNDSNRSMTLNTITVSGSGNKSYYVSGLYEGTWGVSVGGNKIGDFTVTEESGLLTFSAPAGELVLTPGSDIIPEGFAQISYLVNGGTLPDNAPTFYEMGKETVLPKPVRGEDAFKGWYTSPDFNEESKVIVIPSSATGTFTVYAAYLSTMIDEQYTSSSVNISEAKKTINNIFYAGEGKTGSSFVSSKTLDGDGYLVWTKGTADPAIKCSASLYSKIGKETTVTFTVSLAKDGDNAPFSANFRLRSDFGTKVVPVLFSVGVDGKVTSNGVELFALDDEFTTIKVVFDFATGKCAIFDETGKVYNVFTITVNYNGVTTTLDWLPHMTTHIFEFYAPTGGGVSGSIRISGFKAVAGAEFEIPADPT